METYAIHMILLQYHNVLHVPCTNLDDHLFIASHDFRDSYNEALMSFLVDIVAFSNIFSDYVVFVS